MPAEPPRPPGDYGTLAQPTESIRPHPPAAEPDPDRPAPPGFELREGVGRGGMGVVYRARDLALDRDVAVKVLHPDSPAGGPAARRFVAEAKVTAGLQHPGIPPVYHVGTLPDGRPFLAMKLIKGQTLDALLKTGPTRDRLVGVFEDVCQAVGYAHSKGVIHRDLKPQNVMVGAFGQVQVMDWGLSKRLASRESERPEADPEPSAGRRTAFFPAPHDSPDATRAGAVLGTPAFMAPEQARGATDGLDARTDVFGLGAVFCTLLTGQPPFVGEDVLSTHGLAARAELTDAFARLDACGASPELVAVCKRCLAADRADRPADGGAVAAAVAAVRATIIDRARRAEVKTAEWRARRKLVIASATAVTTVLLAGAAMAGWQAFRALAAERATAAQLGLTQKAEADARTEAGRAGAAEQTALAEGKRARAAEEFAREEEQKAKAAHQLAVSEGERARQEEGKARTAAELARQREAEARDAAADTRAFSDFLTGKILAASRPAGQPGGIGRDAKLSDALRAAEADLDQQFAGRPRAEAAARHALGVTWRNLGEYDRSLAHLSRAVELRRAELGPTSPDTLTSVSSLAMLHRVRGDLPTAERLAREALDGRREALKPSDPAIFTSVHNLAEVLRAKGDPAAAEPLFREALDGRRAALTDAHPDTLSSIYGLATVYQQQGKLADAEPLLRQVRDGSRTATGAPHPVALHCVHNLANLLWQQGKPGDAEPLFREALAGYRAVLSDTHPDTLNAAFNLGRLLRARGKDAAAEPLLREAYAGRRVALGDGNPDTARAARELADVLFDRRRYARAVPLLEAEKPARSHLLGLALAGAGRPAAAEPHLLAAEAGLTAADQRGWRQRVTAGLVAVYTATDRPVEATRWRERLAALPAELAPAPQAVR